MNPEVHIKKVVLITGTSRGIGKYLAEYYSLKGYRVIGCSRTSCDIRSKNYLHFNIDICDEKEVIKMFSHIRKEFGQLNILINNAAINPAISPALLIPKSTIVKAFEVNVFAVMVMCREAAKLMSRTKSGRIINFSSMAAKLEVSGETIYTTTKAAINSYTKVLAKEIYKSGITVNAIAPSAIETDMSAQINQEALMEVLAKNTIPQFGKMSDVSNLLDLIIKEESNAITGQIIYLGGV